MNVPRPLIGIIAILLLVGLLAGGVLVISDGEPLDSLAGTPLSAEDDHPEADSDEHPPLHQHPDEYGDQRGADATANWYSEQLAQRLSDSSASISEGEYELAREALDDEYLEHLERLAGVSDDEAAENETRVDEAYETAAEKQANLSALIESYETTVIEYEAAHEANNSDEAEDLAAQLETLFRDIEATGEEIQAAYAIIEDERDADLSGPKANIDATIEEIAQEQAVVRESQLTETTLEVSAEREQVSITEPLTITGSLEEANGSALANKEVQLAIDEQYHDLETDDDGEFAVDYTPTPTTPLSTEALKIRFVPADNSSYLESDGTLNVSISQVQGDLTDLTTPAAAGYGDELAIDGVVEVNGDPIDEGALEVSLAGESLGPLNTTEGTLEGGATIPADIPAGDHELTIDVVDRDQAFTMEAQHAPLEITETDTEIAVQAEPVDDETLNVTGSLETSDGVAVSDQPVVLSVDGAGNGTVQTDSSGQFVQTVEIDSTDLDDEDVHVQAIFEGEGTNLVGDSTDTTVPIAGSSASLFDGLSLPLVVGALFVVTVLAVGGMWWRRRAPPTTTADSPDPLTYVPDQGPVETPPTDLSVSAVLDQAGETLDANDPNTAVRLAYLAVRHHLAGDERDIALTHWEFYAKHRAIDRTALQSIVETYEQAAFAPIQVSTQQASRVLTSARRVCTSEDTHAISDIAADD